VRFLALSHMSVKTKTPYVFVTVRALVTAFHEVVYSRYCMAGAITNLKIFDAGHGHENLQYTVFSHYRERVPRASPSLVKFLHSPSTGMNSGMMTESPSSVSSTSRMRRSSRGAWNSSSSK